MHFLLKVSPPPSLPAEIFEIARDFEEILIPPSKILAILAPPLLLAEHSIKIKETTAKVNFVNSISQQTQFRSFFTCRYDSKRCDNSANASHRLQTRREAGKRREKRRDHNRIFYGDSRSVGLGPSHGRKETPLRIITRLSKGERKKEK